MTSVRSTNQALEEKPKVSVVVPCHNYAQYLDNAVQSALSQEGVDVDVTIVDDASTDDSLLIARRWEKDDPRVRVRAHETNEGHIATFNEALDSATSPYVVKLDPDDLLTPGSLRRSAEVLNKYPRVMFVYGQVAVFSGDVPTRVKGVGPRRTKIWTGQRWIEMRVKRLRNVIYQPEVMIRTSGLLKVGGHRAEIPAASDFNLWLRLASVGSVAYMGGAVQGLARRHPTSMQHTIHAGKLADFRARRSAFEQFFEEASSRITGADRLREINRSALALDALRLAFEETEDGNPTEEYLSEAASLDPSVVRTIVWRSNSRRVRDQSHNGLEVRLERRIRDLQARIRWRLWRRFGI